MEEKSDQPSFRSSRVRRWVHHLWREWTVESFRPIAPAFAKPNPAEWRDDQVTAAWLGHSTVLVNFFGINILTDPVLFPRIGIRVPFLFTIGPKRLTEPALRVDELPRIDLILLSHAHFDHIDWRTLNHLGRGTGFQPVNRRSGSDHRQDHARSASRQRCRRGADATKLITAPRTRDLLGWTRFRDITELRWGERKICHFVARKLDRFNRSSLPPAPTKEGDTPDHRIDVVAVPVKHWGARMQRDDYRGYNGYLIERNNRRILFAGDTAFTDTFAGLRKYGPIDLAIFAIAAYNPWIRSHCSPEQAVQMANDAGARFIMPVHHQTFRLSFEPFREPIERFEAALSNQPERIALREIGETFVLPP